MRIKIIGILVVILGSSTSCMMMAPMHTSNMMHNHHQNEGINNDLVCGTEININEAVSYNYSGNMYYFDSDECMSVFQKNPDRFIKEYRVNENKLSFRSALAITGGALFMLGMMVLMIF